MTIPDTMLAARLHAAATGDEPGRVSVDEVPVPTPGPGQVLVEVDACGICASDLHVVQGVTPHGELPMTLGHEVAGTIAAAGEGVSGWLPGDRVAVAAGIPCGVCEYCTVGRINLCNWLQVPGVNVNGGQAGYVAVDERLLVPVPGVVPLEQAAILTDAVATAYHALKRGGAGDDTVCAIFGLGGLGMHAVLLAKLAGATVIGVDVDPVNLERAKEWGADEVVDASDGKPARHVRELSEGGVDRSFEFVGSRDASDQAIKSLRRGGRCTIVGVSSVERLETISLGLFVANELEVVGSFGSTQQDLNELMDLVEAGRLDLSRSITHRWAIEEFDQALHALETREGHPIRMVVTHR
ncbi:MAG: zinc-binding dehydrogenase [Nitriliruptorales bacterium]|nr:zinc-binding dehydrogenase [Nitriliruptorales bacterium]